MYTKLHINELPKLGKSQLLYISVAESEGLAFEVKGLNNFQP